MADKRIDFLDIALIPEQLDNRSSIKQARRQRMTSRSNERLSSGRDCFHASSRSWFRILGKLMSSQVLPCHISLEHVKNPIWVHGTGSFPFIPHVSALRNAIIPSLLHCFLKLFLLVFAQLFVLIVEHVR